MKALTLMIVLSFSAAIMAKEVPLFSQYTPDFDAQLAEANKVENYDQNMKVTYLTKLLEHQQKAYDEKISFLENELQKTKARLIEKSLNQDKIEEAMND